MGFSGTGSHMGIREYARQLQIRMKTLTKNTHRSSLGTPIHRFVPCRLSAVLQDQG